MEKHSISSLDENLDTCDQKQTNLKESRLQTIQRYVEFLVHACQCRDANCELTSCLKMKKIFQHTRSCKQPKTIDGCSICKQLMLLCCYHAKYCQEAKCLVPFCIIIKDKLKSKQFQHRLQQTQVLKQCINSKQNLGVSNAVPQTSPGNSNSISQPSPVAQPDSSLHPSQSGIGMKSCTAPPVSALQAVQQVQATAARQTAEHLVAAYVSYGKDFDLCISCRDKMENRGFFPLHENLGTCDQEQTDLKESRLLTIQSCIKFLVHACQCSDANCRLPSCTKMKKIMQHARSCKQPKTIDGCSICKQLISLCCYHAKYCQEVKCPVPFCIIIKDKLKRQQLQHRLQQAKILKQCLAAARQTAAHMFAEMST